MVRRLAAISAGFWLALVSSVAAPASFCNISGSRDDGVEFILAMDNARHVADSDYVPNALLLKNRKSGAIREFPAAHCRVHFFDPNSGIFLERMHVRCDRGGRYLTNTRYEYKPWQQAFVCTQGCSKHAPRAMELEICR